MANENPYGEKLKFKFTNKIRGIKPLRDHIIVNEMNFRDRKLASGIVLLSDDGKTDGIRPRWCRVYAIGPEQKDIVVGQWVLVEHGRWTRGVHVDINGEELTLRRVDKDALLLVSDEEPDGIDTISQAVDGEQRQRVDWSQQ